MSTIKSETIPAEFPYCTIPHMLKDIVSEQLCPRWINFSKEDGMESYSSGDFYQMVQNICLGLQEIGVQPGQGFGIIAPSSPKWLATDFAAQTLRAVTIPIFPNISLENFHFEIQDSNTRFLLIHSIDELSPSIREQLERFDKIITLTPWKAPNAITFEELLNRGAQISQQYPHRFEELLDRVQSDTLATIVYTSGSTGTPKGVEITQANLCHQMSIIEPRFPLNPKETVLSILPLAHIFQRTLAFYFLYQKTCTYFIDDPKQTAQRLPLIKPHLMMVVPHLMEKIFAGILKKSHQGSPFKKAIAGAAINYARHTEKPSGLLYRLYDRLVYSKFRSALGGNIRLLVSGGSALHPKLNQFFCNAGLSLYQGYGMTEHSPVISANFPGMNRPGSVGKLLPDVEARIAEDGELLVRSPSVMRGYHNAPETNAEVLKNGWLHTGDLGEFDSDHYLYLKGRKKELFKTSTGKYVSPSPIETALCQSRVIDKAMIIADNRKFVAALVFPDPDLWQEAQKEGDSEIRRFDRLVAASVSTVNRTLNEWEKVRKYKVVDIIPTPENELLTPTLKIRREKVHSVCLKEIEELYSQ
jgi:long-chain acyl-CoA synthetase